MNTVAEPKNKVEHNFKNVEAFQEWAYEQKLSYEFANKTIIRKQPISIANLSIIWYLQKYFDKSKLYQNALLIGRVGMRLVTDNFRIPDLAYFTAEQCVAAAKGEHPIPQLAIEFLSKSKSAEDIANKINDYFASGVKMVWYIYPKTEVIYVYTSPKDIRVFQGDDVCSASPIIPDFEFPTKEIFKKEPSL